MSIKPLKFFAAGLYLAVFCTLPISSNAADLSTGKSRVELVEGAPQQYDKGDWTGLYFGSHLGYTNGDTGFQAPAGSFNADSDSVSGGILGGYNWQSGLAVFGIEADLSWISDGDASVFGANSVTAETNWLTSIRARGGYLYTPQILLYLTAGIAWADIDLPVTGAGGGRNSETFSGYQVGAGAEIKISSNWSTRFEYIYTDLEDETLSYAGGNISFDPDFHTARAAVIFHF